uniref:Uncharacterized protein n=1 Tax=Arundo donax TaxID=35708 RepID=A0A0A8Y900_ARUDO
MSGVNSIRRLHIAIA